MTGLKQDWGRIAAELDEQGWAVLPGLLAAESARVVHSLQFPNAVEAATWKQWSPRAEISPEFSFDPKGGRDGRGALKIAAHASSDFGAWGVPNSAVSSR